MMLQPHPIPQPNDEPMHTTKQVYMDTLHATQREANLTMTLLQDIPTCSVHKTPHRLRGLVHGHSNLWLTF